MLVPMKTIAFLLPERANIATMENARQGFMAANLYLQRSQRAPCFDVRVVAEQAQVRLDGGRITVNADSTLRDVGAVDICVVPPLAGDIPEAVSANAMMTEWLVGHHESGGEVASLCLGAALPAAGQLLNDQQAVVHWAACTDYGVMFPKVRWISDRVVLAGNRLYTSGGAFSSAHLVLHLIEKYTDRDTAIWCAKFFQLDWSRQSQLPFSVFAGRRTHDDDLVRTVQDHIEGHFSDRLTVDGLAARFLLGRRTLERRFREATQNSVVEYMQRIRVEAAKHQLERSRKTVGEVMYEVGYNDPKAFRDVFNKYAGMTPVEYRERYA